MFGGSPEIASKRDHCDPDAHDHGNNCPRRTNIGRPEMKSSYDRGQNEDINITAVMAQKGIKGTHNTPMAVRHSPTT